MDPTATNVTLKNHTPGRSTSAWEDQQEAGYHEKAPWPTQIQEQKTGNEKIAMHTKRAGQTQTGIQTNIWSYQPPF